MKKNNSYLADDEINLGDLLRTLWREKILILSISIICSLLSYLYVFFKPEQFITEITIKNAHSELLSVYTNVLYDKNNKIIEQYNSDFKLNFLSLDNVESFVEKSRELDKFKEYLKSKNITAKQYFEGKINTIVNKKNKNSASENYSLTFITGLDGDVFFNNYAEFIKNTTILEYKKNLKLGIENKISYYEEALEFSKSINLENSILLSNNQERVNEPTSLFYKGSKALSHDIISLKKLSQKLENDQFNYNFIIEKASSPKLISVSRAFFFLIGIFIGLFFSIVIISSKYILQNKQ
jgi:LPS O-antigen subunit length determinant protein (WzzB/FepE family)